MGCAIVQPSKSVDGSEKIMSEVQKAVRERYAAAATRLSEGDGSSSADSGCSPGSAGSCCSPGDATAISLSTGYSTRDLVQIGLSESVSLGCGNPTGLAELKPGETVLDLGSGGGMDVLLSAPRGGPAGPAFGIATTGEMLGPAEAHKVRSGLGNAPLLKGTSEGRPRPQ